MASGKPLPRNFPPILSHPQLDMSNLLALISQYEILERIASHISTLDLLNLSLTCLDLHRPIRKSEAIFERLKRVAICDGRGLKVRQEYKGLHSNPISFFGAEVSRSLRFKIPGRLTVEKYDEELEVRVWNLKCDAVNALPCLKCGVNVCEVCDAFPHHINGD